MVVVVALQGVLGVNATFAIRARVEGLRDIGCAQNPFGAFLLLQVVNPP